MKGQLILQQGVAIHDTLTMSSIDLAELCGQRHDNFCAKVPKVLGDAAPKFLGVETFTNGTGGEVQRKVYRFPKREACLMAMSYSYELQAKVFDRMTELEQRAPAPLTDAERLLITAQALVSLERGQQQLEKRIEQIESGSIPAGWQTVSNLALRSGLSQDKTRLFIKVFSITSKKVSFLAPNGILIHPLPT